MVLFGILERRGGMALSIRHPKDFWTGVIYIAFGLAAIIIGRDYEMGTATKMGPAYFPIVSASYYSSLD
jgi:hypothetical protein